MGNPTMVPFNIQQGPPLPQNSTDGQDQPDIPLQQREGDKQHIRPSAPFIQSQMRPQGPMMRPYLAPNMPPLNYQGTYNRPLPMRPQQWQQQQFVCLLNFFRDILAILFSFNVN